MVSADDIPENLLITQKKLSLACESIMEPAPIARIASVLPQSPESPRLFSSGATMEAAVIIAMVDDPCEVFRITAIMYGINYPNPSAATCCPRLFTIPDSLITAPKVPPAAVTIRIGPAFSMAVSSNLFH